jgi:predicted dehydrogenase
MSMGATALAMSAASYSRVMGANERIGIGLIGCGSRGVGAHMAGVKPFAKEQNVEFTAVCDPWRLRREAAAAEVKTTYGLDAEQYVSYRELLQSKRVDAVMIASCDHQHTTHLEAVVKAKKDVYCEKPLGMELDRLNAACDAVRKSGVVFQAGTQLRSLPSMTGARKVYQSGILGTVGRIEQCRNGERPYWYEYVKSDAKAEDVDWAEFLMDRPKRPFSAIEFTGWYGFRDFSAGPVPQLGSHFIDLVHYITGAKFPKSAVCLGGTYTWRDENKFTCPDCVQAVWDYPEGFQVTYSTNFGNGSGNSFKMFGNQGVLDLVNWTAPVLTAEGASKNKGIIRGNKPVEDVPTPDHFLNWLQCLRSRQTPNADIEAAYQHAVAVILAVEAFDSGSRQVFDPEKRTMKNG